MGHGDNAGGRVQRDDGNKVRVDAMGSLLLIELGDLPLTHDHSAHAGSDNDADTMRLFLCHLKPGISQGFFRRDERELGIAIHSFGLDGVKIPFGGERVDLSGDL